MKFCIILNNNKNLTQQQSKQRNKQKFYKQIVINTLYKYNYVHFQYEKIKTIFLKFRNKGYFQMMLFNGVAIETNIPMKA